MKAGSAFYEASLKKVLPEYGITLREVDDWSCCGASAAHTVSEMAGYALAARNIAAAEGQGLDLVAPCSACYSRSKIVNEKMRGDRALQAEVNAAIEPLRWTGSIDVKNIIEVFTDYVGLAHIARKNKFSLAGLRIA
jgi:heterodisulfide reductase subunit B